jgi:hypothetical protein
MEIDTVLVTMAEFALSAREESRPDKVLLSSESSQSFPCPFFLKLHRCNKDVKIASNNVLCIVFFLLDEVLIVIIPLSLS